MTAPSPTPPGQRDPGARAGAVPAGSARVRQWADKLWVAVRDMDEYSARDVIANALDAGLDAETVLLDMIAAVQQKVGVEWAADRMSVADEHAATAISDRVIAALPPVRPAEGRGRITVSCVDQEWHALPARLLAETLRLRGWQVDYLGAQVPTRHLITHVHRTNPLAVCLSGSLPTRLPAAHEAITACQATGVPVMAGGAAFGADGRLARRLGADAWAPDARAAADRLATPLPQPPPPHQLSDDLPHLIDQEYTLVSRTARRLVRDTYAGLLDAYPAMADYEEHQKERTAEDLSHIVDFLTAALYVDDSAVFTSFLQWTAEILVARGVPAQSLLPALNLLKKQLRDFPRATSLVEAGHTALAPTPLP
ncbi:cobalamin-dependent protein [Streptomyces sp. NPDC001941]|uniref:cobalamin B12-binding domain-containing protein n=1 Tax=Streptomyces sp. NPDC001941 TaxID=3154659 RepID=UPI00332BA26E